MRTTTYLVYRYGSNAANQHLRGCMPVAIVEATSRNDACWVASLTVGVYNNQWLAAVPLSRAPRADVREVQECVAVMS